MIQQRLEKNLHRLKSWAQQAHIEAFRIYDRDIPEYPYIVDKYQNHFLIYDRSVEHIDAEKNHLPELLKALTTLFPNAELHLKKRQRQTGLSQYEKINSSESHFSIQEGQARFWVNLEDYLDTGLFLDHRPLRFEFRRQLKPNSQFLNLFCYTGSVSVAAALGGAKTTNVDLSRTYLEWAQDNFSLNQLHPESHTWIQEDVLQYLRKSPREKFDVIFLDPPTFSNSQRMATDFEVEKDQVFLVTECMKRLNQNGILYFSNNKRTFKLASELEKTYRVKDISAQTIPKDFHDQKIHHCFTICHLQDP